MNVEIGTEAAQFPEKEYINGIFVAVQYKFNCDSPFSYLRTLFPLQIFLSSVATARCAFAMWRPATALPPDSWLSPQQRLIYSCSTSVDKKCT
jgi:hypothetical protein